MYKITKIIEKKLFNSKERLNGLQAALSAMNPQAVLQRGYSITRVLPDKVVLADSARVSQNQHLEIILARGALEVSVVKRHLQEINNKP